MLRYERNQSILAVLGACCVLIFIGLVVWAKLTPVESDPAPIPDEEVDWDSPVDCEGVVIDYDGCTCPCSKEEGFPRADDQ
jgi:hypothetical protein